MARNLTAWTLVGGVVSDQTGRRRWWFAALGAASFILLAVFYSGKMLLEYHPAPDSPWEWAVTVVFVVPFYLLLGLAGELALEVIVGLLKIPFDGNLTDEEPQTPERRSEIPWRGLRALVMLPVGLCLVPVLYFTLVFIYGH